MPNKNRTENSNKSFNFKQFSMNQDNCAMKIGTDGVLLGAWSDVKEANNILDIGTGTGVIAIMLGQRNTHATIHGIEVDELATQQAKENMASAPWSERLNAFLISIQQYALITDRKYDLIVSNPPFFTGGTLSSNQDKTNVRHTVKLPHGELLEAVRALLTDEGRFCVILPLIEGLRFQELAESYHLYCTKRTDVIPVLEKKATERLLLQFEKTRKPIEINTLVIQKASIRHNYTDEYIQLTKDFYTIFE